MANKAITMQKLRQIIRLKQEGYSNRKIARMLCVHRETVRRYAVQMEKMGLDYESLLKEPDSVLESVFEKPKYAKGDAARLFGLQELFPGMEKELGRVGVDKWNLWSEYIQGKPDGYTYSHFCREFKRWEQKQDVSAHFEHKAGDKLFVDFTGKKLVIVDKQTGEMKELEVFVAVFGFSSYIYMEATASQKKEDFIAAVENALHYFGGVPQAIVTDNLTTAVTKSSKYEPQVNETFESFALHYGTTILPTRSYKPKDKALVEGAVSIVYRRIYAPFRNTTFFTLEEFNTARKPLLESLNAHNFQKRALSRKILFDEVEKKELRPLPGEKYEMKHYRWLTVQKSSHIYLSEDKGYYSVPFKYLREKVKVAYTARQVEIYFKFERIAIHLRERGRIGYYTTVSDHMPSSHNFVAGWNPERFKSWADGIGQPTRLMVEKIMETKTHPEQGYKACVGILALAKKVGKERINNACQRAMDCDGYGYIIVKNILHKGLDKEPVRMEISCTIPSHENVRGQGYYK